MDIRVSTTPVLATSVLADGDPWWLICDGWNKVEPTRRSIPYALEENLRDEFKHVTNQIERYWTCIWLVGGLEHFIFFHILGIFILFD